jgi:hypothetical protein
MVIVWSQVESAVYRTSLLLAFLLLSAAASAQVKLDLASATVQVDPHTGKADGVVKITLGNDPAIVTLRASTLALGDGYAFVRFTDNHADNIDIDPKATKCRPGVPCPIPFTVADAWKSGLYQGTITASTESAPLTSIALSAVRTAPSFQPVLTSDALHGGRLVVDATSQRTFLLTVQNPQGAHPGEFALTDTADASLHCDPTGPLAFSPAKFHLEPGASQAGTAAILDCVPAGEHFLVLHIGGSDDGGGMDTVVDVTVHAPGRIWKLLGFVILGSIVSVLLNNIFPVSRARTAMRANLRQAIGILQNPGQAGAALVDGLTAEARRIELSLKQIHFFSSTKANDIQAAQANVTLLMNAADLARRIGQTRSANGSATLPISTHAVIREKLRDAEDALRDGDSQTAQDRLTEAQAKLTEARKDVQQTALTTLLGTQLKKMLTERGKIEPPPAQQPPAKETEARAVTQKAGQQAGAAAGSLVQKPWRIKPIYDLVAQLAVDLLELGSLDARDKLDVERDLYIADVWTEYVEPRLHADPDRYGELAASLLDSLFRNPKSEQVQTLLDLLRSETTPHEIALSLARNEGWVDSDLRKRALEMVDIAFSFTHPALQAVPAAKRLLIYDWDTGDETSPPPSVDRFNHYFRSPRRPWELWKPAERDYVVTLAVRVPFSSHTEAFPFGTVITARTPVADWWRVEPMEIASFIISAAIAAATAFGTQYASGVPDELTWAAYSSAFMLGFGLDQLRDTISPVAATMHPATPPAGPAKP